MATINKKHFIDQINILIEQWLNRDLPEYGDELELIKLSYITLCGQLTHTIGRNMNIQSSLSSNISKEVNDG